MNCSRSSTGDMVCQSRQIQKGRSIRSRVRRGELTEYVVETTELGQGERGYTSRG